MEPLTSGATAAGVALRRDLGVDRSGVLLDPAAEAEPRLVAAVNRSSLVATVYDPLWRGRSVAVLTRGGYGGRRETDAMTAWLAPSAGDAVLDVGCGSGHYLRALHAARPDAELHGTDLSLAFLRTGARRLARDGVGATLVRADAHDLPYADDTFAAAAIGGTPNELRDRPTAFAELARVLEPGGRLWFMASVRGDGPFARFTARTLAWTGLALPGADTLLGELQDAGFRAGRIEHRPPLLLGRFTLDPSDGT